MHCFECDEDFANNSLLIKHYKCSHYEKRSFFCCECKTTFSSFDSIRVHRIKKHSDVNDIADNNIMVDNNAIVYDSNDMVNNDCDNLSACLETNYSSDSDTEEDELDDKQLNDLQNLSEQESCVLESGDESKTKRVNVNFASLMLLLIAKLYSYIDVPRNRIYSILNDIFDTQKIFLENISQNLPDCEILSKNIVENLKSNLKLDSEYMIFKKFMELKTLIMPERAGYQFSTKNDDHVKLLHKI